jgi:TetR/AcrR family transcriptional regulator
MVVSQRAVGAEDKAARRSAILDAVQALLERDPESFASVAQVAETAGLAKGTVYLYFETKEEMTMALHQRDSAELFNRLEALLIKEGRKITVEKVVDGFCEFVRETPLFLHLGAFCHLALERNINPDVVYTFRLKIAARLSELSQMMVERFNGLDHERGMMVLKHTYAFAIGTWQLTEPSELGKKINERPGLEAFRRDFHVDLKRGLIALWRGHLAAPVPANTRKTGVKK